MAICRSFCQPRIVILQKEGWRNDLCHPRGGLRLGWRGTLRGVGAGDEGGTAEDVLLRAPGLAVRAAGFGEGPIHGGPDQRWVRHGGHSRSMVPAVGRAIIAHDVLAFIRPMPILLTRDIF